MMLVTIKDKLLTQLKKEVHLQNNYDSLYFQVNDCDNLDYFPALNECGKQLDKVRVKIFKLATKLVEAMK